MSRRTGLDLRDDRFLCELLGREPRQFPRKPAAGGVGDGCVMVTGAGGSVGSELVRQLASRRPAQLVLVDHSDTRSSASSRRCSRRGRGCLCIRFSRT